jgi:hypothetical protein
MAKELGRDLLDSEIVHHKDGNRLNNDPANLELTTRGEHTRHHSRIPVNYSGTHAWCPACQSKLPRGDFSPDRTRPTGLKSVCRECANRRARDKAHRRVRRGAYRTRYRAEREAGPRHP